MANKPILDSIEDILKATAHLINIHPSSAHVQLKNAYGNVQNAIKNIEAFRKEVSKEEYEKINKW